jgi:hypothetical protein
MTVVIDRTTDWSTVLNLHGSGPARTTSQVSYAVAVSAEQAASAVRRSGRQLPRRAHLS